MALKNVKKSLDRIFDKNLQDLVRGIRNHKDTEARFVAQCIDEIKAELKQDNMAAKANAVNKLIYLQMLGYDISWAAFNIIEVMSAPKFTFKRIGYFAAAQSFHADTDVLMLTTNLIRKDLGSQNTFDAAISLNGLSCFMTADLARDLANDIFSLMSSNRPYTRKRAVLISYRIFLRYPEALRPAFPRLKEKLEDPDQGVQSAAVNVICELARKNPKNYLSLAPVFFKLMTSSTNNWVLIKIIKLFGALTPLEPRLGKKLIEPLTNLIHNTSAMSLLYECINTVIQGMQDHAASIQLCVQKLRILIEDSDQNLKYLGLLAMSRILKTHPKAVQAHKDLILQCLDDKDESIRLRALDLLSGMVSKKNLMEIIKKLLLHVERADGSQYRDELLSKIIEICSQNNYQYITNFEWYITVLVELTRMDGTSRHGSLVSTQLLDVAIRVRAIREFAANQMAAMLENAHAMMSQLKRNGMQEVLFAAAYICGEFSEFLSDPDSLLLAMLRPRVLTLPSHIQGIYIQNLMKIFAAALSRAEENDDKNRALVLTRALLQTLPSFVQSSYLEVQERSSCILTALKYIEKQEAKGLPVAEELALMFKGELNPVAPKAQRKVPVPDGLDLDAWINDPPSSSEEEEQASNEMSKETYDEYYSPTRERTKELTAEQIQKRREEREKEQANNPHYLMSSKAKICVTRKTMLGVAPTLLDDGVVEDRSGAPYTPPLVTLKAAEGYQNPDADEDFGNTDEIELSTPLHVPGLPSSERYLRLEQERRRHAQAKKAVKKRQHKKGKKKKKTDVVSEEEEEDIAPTHEVEIMQEELPEGATKTDSEEETTKDDVYKALDIDLDTPLTSGDVLPKPRHREVTKKDKKEENEERKENAAGEKIEKKKKKKKEKKEKKKSRKHREESLLVKEAGEDYVSDDAAVEPKKEVEKNEQEQDDMSFWLSKNNDASSNVEPVQINGEVEENSEVVEEIKEKKKEPKHKKKKEGKKHKKKQKHTNQEEKEVEEAVEENLLDLNSYKLLGENKEIKVDFAIRSSLGQEKRIVLSCVFSNLTDKHIKNVEFNVLDTLNTRLIRPDGEQSHDAVPIPFTLPPSSRNECQMGLTATSVTMPQRMRGTVTYMVSDEGHTKQEKLDFKLHIPCSSYLVATPLSSGNFAKLLSSGDVTDKSSMQVSAPGLSLKHALQKMCFFLKFSIVEQIDSTASLYSTSIQRHHICLLVKAMPNGSYSIDGKSDNSSILSNIMDEVKATISE